MKYNRIFYIGKASCSCMDMGKIRRRTYLSMVLLGKSFEFPRKCKGCDSPF